MDTEKKIFDILRQQGGRFKNKPEYIKTKTKTLICFENFYDMLESHFITEVNKKLKQVFPDINLTFTEFRKQKLWFVVEFNT